MHPTKSGCYFFCSQESNIERENEVNMQLLSQQNVIILPEIEKAIVEMGFEQLTPIQEQAIPALLEGKDMIGQAQTGTGKTAAFGIPLLQNLNPEENAVQAIVLCPTRELAIQAAAEMRKFAKYMHGAKILPIYGGQDITNQIRSLRAGVSIVVGTPGRIMDHLRRKTLKLDNIKTIVLDEADEMLNMGFREDIELILKQMPDNHQTALFSATMPQAILDITNQYQKDAVKILVASKELTIPLVKQYYYEVKNTKKEESTARLLDYYQPKRTLIFCNTKRMVDQLNENLKGRGYFAEALHGDLSQAQRDRVMKAFRSGTCDILIATDVAARGLDVNEVEAVINYDIPQDIEYYVHRIGRTGRAGKSGRAFTLVVGREVFKIKEIERACKTRIESRSLPSAADLTDIKAKNVFQQVFDVIGTKELEGMQRIIEDKCNEEDCTALEIAAAFLKLQMGEKPVDIPTEKFVNDGSKDRNGSRDRSRNFRGRGDRNSSGGGRSYGARSSEGGRSSEGRKPYGERSSEGGRSSEGRKPYGERSSEVKKPYGERSSEGRKPYGERSSEGRKSYGEKSSEGGRGSYGNKSYSKSSEGQRSEKYAGNKWEPKSSDNK